MVQREVIALYSFDLKAVFMTVSFFGHRTFVPNDELKFKILEDIKSTALGENTCFLLGGYGGFDSFAFSVAKEYKKLYCDTKLFFVTPYISETYQKNKTSVYADEVDEIIYPPLEKVPHKFAIAYRNRYMVNMSDIVIFYVKRNFGGAYQAMQYAKKKGKRIINYSEEILASL